MVFSTLKQGARMSNEEPQYVSKPHRGSWGQEYRIYHDRIELRAKILFRTLIIQLCNVELIIAKSKIEWSDMYRHPMDFWLGYNNDIAWNKHVCLRQKGWRPTIRFTPENPEEFVAKCNEMCRQLSN